MHLPACAIGRFKAGVTNLHLADAKLRFSLGWALTWPLRFYWRWSPYPRGKGFIIHRVLPRFLPPPPNGFVTTILNTRIKFYYREEIGVALLLRGSFEPVEIATAAQYAKSGSTAVDVGAHVGLFTLPLSAVVGASGRVLAFEPHPDNYARLRENIRRNKARNISHFCTALGSKQGYVGLNLGEDPAYHSIGHVAERRKTGKQMRVPITTLDQVWREAGSPGVSFLKIDVEGAELDVLEGSRDMLTACTPTVLAESFDKDSHDALTHWFLHLNYAESLPLGLVPGNCLFLPNPSRESGTAQIPNVDVGL